MADWLHCNKCMKRFQPGIKLHLTDCGHVLCDDCFSRMNITEGEKICIVCRKPAKTMQLSQNVDENIKMFFKPFEEITEKLKQVAKFQTSNSSNLLKHMTLKYGLCKKELVKSQQKNCELSKELHRLRGMAQMPPGGKSPYFTSTPTMFARNTNQIPNNSITSGPFLSPVPRPLWTSHSKTHHPGHPQRLAPSSCGSAKSHSDAGRFPSGGSTHSITRMTPPVGFQRGLPKHLSISNNSLRPSPVQIVPRARPDMVPIHRQMMRLDTNLMAFPRSGGGGGGGGGGPRDLPN